MEKQTDDLGEIKFGHRVADRIMGAIIATSVLITIIFLAVFFPFEERRMKTAQVKARLIMEIVAHRDDDRLANEIFEDRLDAVRLRLQQITKAEGLIHASVYDQDGELLAQDGLPVRQNELALEDMRKMADAFLVRELNLESQLAVEYMKPLLAFGEPIGFIRMRYSLADVQREQRWAFTIFGALLISILLCLVIFLTLILRKTVIRPIRELGESMETFAEGDLFSRTSVEGDDEIGHLGQTFNYMAERIRNQQESLIRAQEKYQSIFENALEGIFQITPDGELVGANQALADILGYRHRDDLLAETKDLLSFVLIDQEERKRLRRRLERRGRLTDYEMRLRKRDGSEIWGAVSLRITTDGDGNPRFFEGSLMDITARKEADRIEKEREAAEAATKAKGEFLARMSHEIRTPMNAVTGLAQLMFKTDLNGRQRDYMEKILVSARSLLRIINDILDFSRIEQGRLSLEETDFEFDAVLSDLADVIGPQVKEKGLEVHFAVDSRIPPMLIGDSLRLGQVLLNLTSNAVKFTDQGEILVSACPDRFEKHRISILFTVRDSGPGLSRDQVDRLFQSFTQADETITRKYGGSGLGLAISKELVELMGGSIWVESEPGRGCEFCFTTVFGISRRTPARETLNLEPLRNLKVLVVDDNATARAALTTMVTSFGWKADTASNGDEALVLISRAAQSGQPYGLVLMDWNMPGPDGIETSKKIKSTISQSDAPIILMITAYDREDVALSAEKAGLNGFLSKPVSRSLLLDSVLDTFNLGQLPVASEDDAATCDAGLTAIAGSRVLLVEDNAINRQVAREFLLDAKMVVDVAENGQQALEKVKGQPYDLVLMDIQMPVMDGLEAARRIRSQPNFVKMPIVAMTAHALAGDRKKSIEAGMNDHITKPVNPNQLRQILVDWIDPARISRPGDGERPDRPVSKEDAPSTFSLPGIDTAEGLKNFSGKMGLYKTMLRDFQLEHLHDFDVLKASLDDGRWKEAEFTAHSLKGVAALLGAVELSAASKAVEADLRVGRTEKAVEGLPVLEKAFLKVIRGIADFGEGDQAPSPGEKASERPGSVRSSIHILEMMIPLLKSGNVEVDTLIQELNQVWPEKDRLADLDKLNRAVDHMDYERGLEMVSRILRTLKESGD